MTSFLGKLYRVYIENKNYPDLKKIVLKYSDSFTVLRGEGVWFGDTEHCLIIEIVKPHYDDDLDIDGLLYDLKKAGAQDVVLMTNNDVEVQTTV